MKQQAVTLETIAQTLEKMQMNEKHVHLKLDKLEDMQSDILHINSRLGNIETNLSDTQENVHHLVAGALMRDELQPILNREIAQSESRMISHMEGFIRHVTMEDEVLAHAYRIDRLEKFVGLPKTA
jgi:hypothetical protein